MDTSELKQRVGAAAAEEIQDGMVVGLGTGSTVAALLEALGDRMRTTGLKVTGVPTSQRTADRCQTLGIPLTTLDQVQRISLCIDGADEVAPGLQLIKGGGGALLREKVVAASSQRFLVIADETKEVDHLGQGFDLPVEVVPFARPYVTRQLEDLSPTLRQGKDDAYVTDNGNHILDLATGPIQDPHALATRLDGTVGVVEHGLFLDMATSCLVGTAEGVRERET